MSSGLGTAIGLCRLLGLFPPETGSRYVRVLYRAYQVLLFAVVCLVSLSMTIQLFTAPNMNLLARTIDMWTLCWTALYKWFYVATFDSEFHAFHRLLNATRAQAAAAHGPAVRRMADERLRLVPMVSNTYALSGFVLTVFLSLGAVVTYPKGYAGLSVFERFDNRWFLDTFASWKWVWLTRLVLFSENRYQTKLVDKINIFFFLVYT